jgi:DNA mismatch repair protein MutS
LFAAPARPAPGQQQVAEDPLAAALSAINPDDLSPREAMDALYRLKEQAAKKAES